MPVSGADAQRFSGSSGMLQLAAPQPDQLSTHLVGLSCRYPAAATSLAGFWQGGYQEVRRQLRGRYPKHPWPEDPSQAQATALTKAKAQAKAQASRLP